MRIWVGEGVGTGNLNSSITSKDSPVLESPTAVIVVGRAMVTVVSVEWGYDGEKKTGTSVCAFE